ncbi:MAG: SIMPL domain-containing protein [Bacteroidota bacterium]
MKRFFVIIFIALIGAGMLCATEPNTNKTIKIHSVGEVEVIPDMATFNIDLNCLDVNLANSKKCLVEKSASLIKKLQSFGIASKDIMTTSVNMQKSYTWQNNKRVFEGYKSSTSIFVTVRDINKLEAVYSDLLENKNTEVGGLNYTHSKIDSLKNEAYLNALSKANDIVDKLLTRLPEKNKEIIRILNGEYSSPAIPQYRGYNELGLAKADMSSMDEGSVVSINKGTLKIQADLYIEYSIK